MELKEGEIFDLHSLRGEMHNDIMKCIIKNATVALFKLGMLRGKCLLNRTNVGVGL